MDMMDFEKQSFRNLVNFYQDELRLILQGSNPSEVFKNNKRRTLRLWGVLEHPDGKLRGGRSRVSLAAQDLLD